MTERTEEEKALLSEAMRMLGKKTSEKKAETARENGKKGGRPRKQDSAPSLPHPPQPSDEG